MSTSEWLPYTASLADYQQQADALFRALTSGEHEARWRFKWEHPRFRGKPVTDVDAATLDVADARTVVARQYAFETWTDLVEFTEMVTRDDAIARFEAAVEAVISGNVAMLQSMLRDDPNLIRARSKRRHHATLLHYIAANGVEGGRQKTPENAVAVAKTLLDAGADVDALADMYDAACTTMSMLVSSDHPARAGVQVALIDTLVDFGASVEAQGKGSWTSPLLTALTFGFIGAAEALVRRGARVDTASAAAGLNRPADLDRLLPEASADDRHRALSLAAQLGHASLVQRLLDAGEDPSRYNPPASHAHTTPLHQAVWAGHAEVVRLLVERGARLDLRDTLHQGTPLGWALYGKREDIAAYLRDHGAET